ncbi:DUF4376 domain-containing protein [Acinetobacter nosocomialis]|uniref:DUF4376 domain-containing protein n=1 Tax=Acinetobacter nosocomialis TaxID=106654 RepID=UPI001901188D|nr:DUF4376 domain-containing protein [Acinetobacter nosocomialis]MBJ9959844.1 DUF4376 domain-containing protein [Acinetobacter nosocomialis]
MTAIVSKDGELLFQISGNEQTVRLNTPDECFAVDDPPSANMYHDKGEWVEMPLQPSAHHLFDFQKKEWIDPRSLDQVKEQKWFEIKQIRETTEFGGFSFNGYKFDSDEKSQSRIIAASALGVEVEWTLFNNTVITLSGEELKKLRQALAEHVSMCHARSRKARESIALAKTKAEVDKISF